MSSTYGTSKMPRMLAPMLIGATLILGGCATTTATGGTKAVCSVWTPVSWSVADTDQTIREAKANNAARAAWCGR